MNCKSVQQSLSAYVDRELPGSEMLALRSHLSHCRTCMREETEIRNLKALLGDLPTVDVPDDLEGRLLLSIHSERRPAAARKPSLAVVAGVAIAAAAITFALLPSSQGSPTTPTVRHRIGASNDSIAFEIRRDQALSAANDPLGGGQAILATDYGRR